MSRTLSVGAGWAVGLLPALAFASDFDVIINEINYHPFTGEDRDAFVEIYNRGSSAVDLSGWRFSEGISFAFPAGASIGPDDSLVVSPDAARTRTRYGIQNVLGNFTGKLERNGEILTLINGAGAVISRVHFEDGGNWPSHADGLGPSLELMTPHEENDQPQKWASSLFLDGTPGRRNSRWVGPQAARTLVAEKDPYRAFKGTAEPSVTLGAWAQPGFDDSAWTRAKGPFGYPAASTISTTLADMPGAYSTFYLRALFDFDAQTLAEIQNGSFGLTLHLSYDDGYVVYLNGVETGRSNAGGTAGTPLPRTAAAPASLDGGSATLNLDNFVQLLVESGNVIAVQGINNTGAAGVADFLLSAELILTPQAVTAAETGRTVVLNEVRPSEGAGGNGFIELFNATAAPIDVGGHSIVFHQQSLGDARYQFPAHRSIPAHTAMVLSEAELGFAPVLLGGHYALVKGDGLSWLDGLETPPAPAGRTGLSFGRFPDGGDDQYLMTVPTSGTANQLSLETSVVINEILYHPPFVAPAGLCTRQCSDVDQWIELHNRGNGPVDVSGWGLSKGLDFTIANPTVIPKGGFLVITADRARFLAKYPGVDPALVQGSWVGALSRASDTVNLRDELGNRVDHVKYGDGTPFNDESPIDGIDDRTILSSEWPAGADDGLGRSIELINAALDARAGNAWALGPAGGTPAAVNSALDAAPPPVISDVSSDPPVPRSTESVSITCRVSSVAALTSVEALWHLEPAGAVNSLELKDDGLSGDGAAGDGVYGGTIPPQANGKVVAWQVRAQAGDGQTALVPRSPAVAAYAGARGPYYLCQVDDAAPPANGSVTYRVVMADADFQELKSRPVTSNVLLPCTFIGEGKAHHAVGIRIRGENTRNDARKAYRIEFPPERTFRGLENVNFLANSIQTEILAADLFRRAGLPVSQEWTVNLVFQGAVDPLYVFKENLDKSFLKRHFGGSDSGNLYRGLDPPGGGPQGDLSYLGETPAALQSYRDVYDKMTNKEEDDYSDIIALTKVFDPAQTPDNIFVETLDALIDANEWARFFAIQSAISNNDGGIETTTGEDYFIYRVPASSPRPDRGKWLLIPWDIGETYTSATEVLFRPALPSIRRFLRNPAFAPLYYANLVDLRNGAFSRFETRQRFYLISSLFAFGTIDGIDSYITARIGFFDENVPTRLSAGILTGNATGERLVKAGDDWKYLKGAAAPPAAWKDLGFVDSGWLSGATGIGYGDGDDATNLADMQQIAGQQPGYLTIYCRKTFNVPDRNAISSLLLNIIVDDGFYAYLNGTLVASSNVTAAAFDSPAPAAIEPTLVEKDITSFQNLLVNGTNVLAVEVHNAALTSSDLSFIPELIIPTGASSGAGCGTILYAASPTIALGGFANGATTASVRVNGATVAYNGFSAAWEASVTLVPGDNTLTVESLDAFGAVTETMQLTVHQLARSLTPVPATLAGNVAWTAAGGPYHLTGNVSVPAGAHLTIGPGTVILGEAGASLIVKGEIEALGTRVDPILFRSASCSGRMGGIALDGTGIAPASFEHHLAGIDIEFAQAPGGYLGTVAVVNAKLFCEESNFRELTANAIDGTAALVRVERDLFERIHEGVHCGNSLVVVLDSTFSHMIGDKDAIDFDGNGPGQEHSRIERCLIEYGSDDGIDLALTTVDIRDNVIRYIQDKGLSLESNGPLGGPAITGNLIYNCGTGIALKNGITIVEGNHNTLAANQEGLNLFAKAGAADGGHGVFDSMIIWDNIFNVKVDAKSTVAFTFSDILEPQAGLGNISADPRFADELGKNYSLLAGSPAIGAGKGESDMGAIPFVAGGPWIFVRGDADGAGGIDLPDAITILNFLFLDGTGPFCQDVMDANDDGQLDIADPVYVLFYLYAQGSAPRPPFPSPGIDPTADDLFCPPTP